MIRHALEVFSLAERSVLQVACIEGHVGVRIKFVGMWGRLLPFVEDGVSEHGRQIVAIYPNHEVVDVVEVVVKRFAVDVEVAGQLGHRYASRRGLRNQDHECVGDPSF